MSIPRLPRSSRAGTAFAHAKSGSVYSISHARKSDDHRQSRAPCPIGCVPSSSTSACARNNLTSMRFEARSKSTTPRNCAPQAGLVLRYTLVAAKAGHSAFDFIWCRPPHMHQPIATKNVSDAVLYSGCPTRRNKPASTRTDTTASGA